MTSEQFEFNFESKNPEIKKPELIPISEKDRKPNESKTDHKIRLLQMLKRELNGEIEFYNDRIGGLTIKPLSDAEQAALDRERKRKDIHG